MLWIKIYPAKCLRGNLHFDLPYHKRGIWYELLLMAGDADNDGLIEYPIGFLASQLGCPLKALEEVLVALERTDRIVREGNKILISNWHLYQKMKGEPHTIKKAKKQRLMPADGPFGAVTNDQYQEDYLNSDDYEEDKKGSEIPPPPISYQVIDRAGSERR